MNTRMLGISAMMVVALAAGYGSARLLRSDALFGDDDSVAQVSAPPASSSRATAAATTTLADHRPPGAVTPTPRSSGTGSKPNATAGGGGTSAGRDYTSTRVTYAEIPSGPLQFNLIRPTTGSNFPVVIWIHGGGFGPGGLNAAEGFEDDFTSQGYAIAALAYRSLLDGLFPAQIEDVKGAIRYLRSESASLNIDPDRIFLLGTSSGGLLSSLAGVTGDEQYAGTTGGHSGVSSEVAGVVDLFGSVTKATFDRLSPTIIPTTYELFGCEVRTSCPDRAKLPIDSYITRDDPPFLIIHGTDDETVPYEGSVELQGLLERAGVEATLLTGDGYGHDKEGLITLYLDEILSFLDSH